MIPFLARSPLVVCIGSEAAVAIARLRVYAATGGVACVEFGPNVFVQPSSYAAIMRATARELQRPVLHAPHPADNAKMIAAADLIVIAPPGVGNRVWLVAPEGEAFSVHLPQIDPLACPHIAELLLEGRIVFEDEHLARPTIRFAPGLAQRLGLAPARMAMPTHTGSGAMH
jgi:hypothetical protein